MVGHVESAIEAVRTALMEPGDPIEVAFSTYLATALEKILELLEAEGRAGAVVVPVKEQFTTTEAARMLGISRSTLMKLIDSGEIDSVKVASHHRIPAPAILRYEKARTEGQHRTAKALEEFAHDAKEAFHNNATFGKQS